MNLKKYYEAHNTPELELKLKELYEEGCETKIDSNGYCWYASSQGNIRYCNKCLRRIDIITKILKERKK